jgi:DNA processing protein
VLSQFPPHQTWNVGAAMTRNAVIAALGRALVVIEASETGGTLDAGIQALAIKRPVIALEFESEATPAGNRLLLERGAIPVHRPAELATILGAIKDPSGAGHSQMPLELG